MPTPASTTGPRSDSILNGVADTKKALQAFEKSRGNASKTFLASACDPGTTIALALHEQLPQQMSGLLLALPVRAA